MGIHELVVSDPEETEESEGRIGETCNETHAPSDVLDQMKRTIVAVRRTPINTTKIGEK